MAKIKAFFQLCTDTVLDWYDAFRDWLDDHFSIKQQFIMLICLIVVVFGGGGFAFWYYSPSQVASRAEAKERAMLAKRPLSKAPNGQFDYNSAGWTPDLKQLLAYRNAAGNKIKLRGQISIPAVNVNVPVFEGVSDYTLAWGAGTAKPGQEMGQGNYAVQGHNFIKLSVARNWFFSNLQKHVATDGDFSKSNVRIQNGTNVYAMDRHKVYTYRVFRRDVLNTLSGSSADVLMNRWESESIHGTQAKEVPVLTMATCYEQYGILHPYQRLVVTSRLVNSTSASTFVKQHPSYFKYADKLY